MPMKYKVMTYAYIEVEVTAKTPEQASELLNENPPEMLFASNDICKVIGFSYSESIGNEVYDMDNNSLLQDW